MIPAFVLNRQGIWLAGKQMRITEETGRAEIEKEKEESAAHRGARLCVSQTGVHSN